MNESNSSNCKSLFIKNFDENSLKLNNNIHRTFTLENFNNFLSFYGLNASLFLNSSKQTWNQILLGLFSFGFIRTLILLFLDPINQHQLCFYLGDFTLLFNSLRKYFIIISLLLISFGIHINHLFNYDSNGQWYELFECLDGTKTPKSIGIKNTKILKKILIFAKIALKLSAIANSIFILLILCSVLFVFIKNVRFIDTLEMISTLFWFSLTIFVTYFISGTIIISSACFQIICYYCLINARCFNQLISNYKTDLSFGWKRLFLKLKFKHLFNQQNQFSIRILKYNKFWSKFYLIMMIHVIPCNIILLQQVLYGKLSLQLKILFWVCFFYQTIFIMFSSLFVCLLNKSMILLSLKLIQFQFNPHLNFDINTKIKVNKCTIHLKII